VKQPPTRTDLEALPEHLVGEIVDGDLHVSPRPRPRHALSTSRIIASVLPAFDHGTGGPGGWWILVEPELHLARHVLVPDLAGWRRERLPELPDAAGIAVVPDWVCEVLSPSTAQLDRTKKLRIFGEQGVGHAWLVDPMQRTVEVFRHTAAGWLLVTTAGDEERVRLEPFDAIELAPARWWPSPPPAGRASEEWARYGMPDDTPPPVVP
jgi:Uma2 family endonuclease